VQQLYVEPQSYTAGQDIPYIIKYCIRITAESQSHEDVWESVRIASALTSALVGRVFSFPGRFTLGKENQVSNGQEAGWPSEPVYYTVEYRNISCPCRESNPGRTVGSLLL
jgi:hypothetical protein